MFTSIQEENGYILAFDENLMLQLHPSKIGGAPTDELNRRIKINQTVEILSFL